MFGKTESKKYATKLLIRKYIDEQMNCILKRVTINNLRNLIIVDKLEGVFAQIERSTDAGKPIVDILASVKLVRKLQSENEHDFALNVLYHELCHCKDYEHVCNKINYMLLPNLSVPPSKCVQTYASCGFLMFGEYVAYRNPNMDLYEYEKVFNDSTSELLKRKSKADIALRLLSKICEESKFDLFSFYYCKNDIDPFIYQLVKCLGLIHLTRSSGAFPDLSKLFFDDQKYENYVSNLEDFLLTSYDGYPDNISIPNFIRIGIEFYKLYNIYNLTLNFNSDSDDIYFITKERT